MSSSAFPTIDLSPIVAGAPDGDMLVAPLLQAAFREWGAFSLVGHGVPASATEAAFSAARRFFEQPLDARLALKVGKSNRGYVPMHQTVYEGNLPDLKESFNLGLPLPSDDPDVLSGKPLHGVNVWPDPGVMPGFRADVERYFDEMSRLGQRLLGPLAICLGMSSEALRELYRKPMAFMRLFHYPPDGRIGEREHGAAEHQDYGFLTLLAQDDKGGLEIRTPDDEIAAIPPTAGAFVVNAGDMLTRITGGAYKSAPHRVINRSGLPRYSIPFFYDPGFDSRFAGMPEASAGEFMLAKFDKFYQYRKTLKTDA